jgi:hypothetical protein
MLRRLVLVLVGITFVCGLPLHVVLNRAAHAEHLAGASEHSDKAPCADHSDSKCMAAAQCDFACSVTGTMSATPPLVADRAVYGVVFPPSSQMRVRAAEPVVDPFPPRQPIRS